MKFNKISWCLGLLFAASTCFAQTYTVTFLGGNPGPAVPASIQYDSVTNQFTSFIVVWDGRSFDLTSSANSPQLYPYQGPPPACTGVNAAQTTLLLLQNCNKANGVDVFWLAYRESATQQTVFDIEWFAGFNSVEDIFDTLPLAPGSVDIFTEGSLGPLVAVPEPYKAFVQPPINADGSSVFMAIRGALPVKFSLTQNDVPTCTLPPATISVTRTASGTIVPDSIYITSADSDSNFSIAGCQYVYNLAPSLLGAGTYRVDMNINGIFVGHAVFALR